MKKITKKVAKGLPVGIRVRKPRYYYQDITATYNTSATENIDLVEFEGLDYGLSYSTLTFKNKKLWNNKQYNGSTRALAPLYENKVVKYGGYSIVGSLTNDNNVFSGFSGSNYLSLNGGFEVGNNTWEVVAKFTTTDSFPNLQGIYHFHNGYSSNGRYGLIIRMQGNKFNFTLSSEYSWMLNATGSYVIQPNTTYWVKASFNGSRYVLSYSLDGKYFIEDISYSSTSPLLSGLNIMVAGAWYSGSSYIEPLLGTLDLNECYMKIDNNLAWVPEIKEEIVQVTPEYLTINKGFIYDVVGNPVKNDYVYSGFSTNDYLSLPVLKFGQGSWEFTIKVRPSAEDIANENPIVNAEQDSRGIRIGTAGTVKGRWEFLVSSGSSWINTSAHYGSHNVEANTTYWLKAGFDAINSKYYLKYSTNGVDYIDDISYSSGTKAQEINHNIGRGINSIYWRGSIDITNASLVADGVKVWGKDAKSIITVAGCLDEGLYENYNETTYNAFVKDNNVLLTNKEDVEGMIWANKVIVPEHLKSAIYKPNYTQEGTLALDLLYNASGFNASSYISSPNVITNATSENYVLVARVTTGGDTSSRNIFWKPASPDYGCGTTGNSWRIWRGSQYSGGSFELNTTYWVVVKQTPSQTTLYYTKDDGTYNSIDELPLGLIGKDDAWLKGAECPYTVFEVPVVRIGNGYGALQEYWTGNIDLTNTGIFKEVSGFFTSYEKIWQALTPISE